MRMYHMRTQANHIPEQGYVSPGARDNAQGLGNQTTFNYRRGFGSWSTHAPEGTASQAYNLNASGHHLPLQCDTRDMQCMYDDTMPRGYKAFGLLKHTSIIPEIIPNNHCNTYHTPPKTMPDMGKLTNLRSGSIRTPAAQEHL
jgi:hypothetical protein